MAEGFALTLAYIVFTILFVGAIVFMIYYLLSSNPYERELDIEVYDVFVSGEVTGIVTRTKGIIRVKGDHSDKFLPNNNYYIKVRETEGMRFELLNWKKT